MGIISAIRLRSRLDRVAMGGSLVAISAPAHWRGLTVPPSQGPLRWFTSLLLPWFVLAAAFAAFSARMLRGNLVETMNEDYIRTARAKGLSERRVIARHGLRAALTPIATRSRAPCSSAPPSSSSRTWSWT